MDSKLNIMRILREVHKLTFVDEVSSNHTYTHDNIRDLTFVMANTLTIEKLISFLKADLLFACCWPLPPTATKWEIIRNKIFRYLSILHGLIMVVAIIYTIYTNRSDLFLIMKLCCNLCTTIEVPLQIFCFSMQYDRLQVS